MSLFELDDFSVSFLDPDLPERRQIFSGLRLARDAT